PSASTVVLAQTKPQLEALIARLGNPSVQGLTFASLASHILVEGRRFLQGNPGTRRSASFQTSDQTIALVLALNAVSTLDPESVAKVCRRTVMRFCATGDREIGIRHLPALTDHLTLIDKGVLVEYSRKLWHEVIQPTHPSVR